MIIHAFRAARTASYPIRTLSPDRHAGLVVTVNTAGGACLTAKLARHEKNRRWMWYEWRSALGEWVVMCPYRAGVTVANATWREPISWAPHADHPWSLPLAAVLEPETPGREGYQTSPPPEPELEPPIPETDLWPYPNLRLGRWHEAPKSEAEAEARVLRAIRLEGTFERVGITASQYCADIPTYFVQIWRRVREQQQDSHVGDVRVVWVPSRRDRDDYTVAMGWLQAIDERDRRIFRMRGANPVFSWRDIGERLKISGSGARQAYGRAKVRLFRQARVGV